MVSFIIETMIELVKKNKLTTLLLLLVVYLLVKPNLYYFLGTRKTYLPSSVGIGGGGEMASFETRSSRGILPAPIPPAEFPPTESKDRLVVQESNLSLVVKNVRQAVDKAIEQAQSLGGYMVSSSLSQPEEAPYATLVLRLPSKSLKSALDYFRSMALKVSSENLYGYDVTDEYTDIEARLATLNKTKAKFEEIMARAEKVSEIMEVQRELINLQNQIDSLKGRQQYLEKTAELARVTLHLSTDEYVLPYAPAKPFRPEVIFKQAVRSLVGTLRWLAKVAIWAGVYSLVIGPVALGVWYFKKRSKR